MGKTASALRWVGKLAAIIGLISLGAALVVLVGMYVVGLDTLNMPAMGLEVLAIPFVLAGGGIGLWLLTKLVLLFVGGGGTTRADGEARATSAGGNQPARTPATAALNSFGRANGYLALLFAALFLIGLGSSAITTALSGTPLAILGGVLTFAVAMLGGTWVQLLNLAVFGGAWFGMRRYEATEAWLLGMVGWALVAVSGLALASRSLGAIAMTIGGLRVLLTGYRARDATTMRRLDTYVSDLRVEPAAVGGGEAEDSSTVADTAGGPVADVAAQLEARDLRDPAELKALVDVDSEFVHPREAAAERLTYWSYLSYGLGVLTVLASLLVGIDLWGFPEFGVLGLLVGAGYLAHAFGLPQDSSFVHVGGLVWYALMLLVAVVTVSPLAILATAGGTYLGWTATPGLRQPEAVLGELSGGADGLDLVGGGLASGAVLGLGLGVVGAVVFAAISVQTKTVYGLLLLLPAIAGGFGVALGVGDAGSRVSGLVGVGAALVGVLLGFRLLSWWMPRGYELQGDWMLLAVPLLGLLIAYRIGTGTGGGKEPDDASVDSADAG